MSPRIITLGITGPIACGKSTVARMTVERGALDHIDADRVTHELMTAGTALTQAIGREFGPDVITQDHGVDRRALGSVVFARPDRMKALEALVHPEVRAEIVSRLDELQRAGKSGVVVIEAIKLLESPLLDMTEAVWLVTCRRQYQESRLRDERGLTGSDAQSRIDSEPRFDRSKITTVIENNGSHVDLAKLVDQEWATLLSAQV